MKTNISILNGAAQNMADVDAQSVHLMVTSPPYPMVEMWDEIFAVQDHRIKQKLNTGRGKQAFELMHAVLDAAWEECDRVIMPGGMVCINIGDATRTINDDFQLYSNHTRILQWFLDHGYTALPDILWRKQTNAPNKFMGSGMLPVGAYVTYEHEYILVLRKGLKRTFTTPEDKAIRRQSAFFWEERNIWFSDVWQDIKGTPQKLVDPDSRVRSGAFPFELAYRLICMFSVKNDVVLDPFCGTGTTLMATLATGRHGIGIELDTSLSAGTSKLLSTCKAFANHFTRQRLSRHIAFVAERAAALKPLKYENIHYGFPVMTRQEQELLLTDIVNIAPNGDHTFRITYDDLPQTV